VSMKSRSMGQGNLTFALSSQRKWSSPPEMEKHHYTLVQTTSRWELEIHEIKTHHKHARTRTDKYARKRTHARTHKHTHGSPNFAAMSFSGEKSTCSISTQYNFFSRAPFSSRPFRNAYVATTFRTPISATTSHFDA
jgi:hypothetical protein